MTVLLNPSWDAPPWPGAQFDLVSFVRSYAGRVKDLDSVRAVWAIVLEGELHIVTLVNPTDRATEDSIFQAELEVMDEFKEPPVAFDLRTEVDSVTKQLREVPAVLQRR